MAFVSEAITTEKDKEYYYSFNPTNILGETMGAYWWAIDREKGHFIYMRCAGSPAWNTIPSFGLFVEGEEVFIEAIEESKGKLSQNSVEITWLVQKMEIPSQLLNKGYNIDSIKKLVTEALEGFGLVAWERSDIQKVIVIFEREPEVI